MVKNGNMRLLLLELIFCRAHIGRSPCRSTPSPVEASSGQEWQYEISTVRAHICRTSTPPVEVPSGQEWQYEIATVRAHNGRSTGRYLSPFLLLEAS